MLQEIILSSGKKIRERLRSGRNGGANEEEEVWSLGKESVSRRGRWRVERDTGEKKGGNKKGWEWKRVEL